MRTQIKICGIQSAELALQTAQAGADYIGIVFVPQSKRFVPTEHMPDLVNAIHQGGAQAVLVVKDPEAPVVNSLLDQVPFDLLQLHGDIPLTLTKSLPYIYATISKTQIIDYPSIDATRDFLMIDHTQAGSGQTFCWDTCVPPSSARWFLAGGLTANNVSQGIKKFLPFAVDVSSGVEDAQGVKQLDKIKTFIQQVHQENKPCV